MWVNGADWRSTDPVPLVLRAEQCHMWHQGSPGVGGDRVGCPRSPAVEAGAAAALQGGPEGTVAVKPRRMCQDSRQRVSLEQPAGFCFIWSRCFPGG